MTFLDTWSSEALQQPFCISIQTLSHVALTLGKTEVENAEASGGTQTYLTGFSMHF